MINFTYTNEVTDNNNLVYLKARWYSSHIRRFISQDSYNLLNRYSYVEGNPINESDPSGHISVLNGTISNTVFLSASILSIASEIKAMSIVYEVPTMHKLGRLLQAIPDSEYIGSFIMARGGHKMPPTLNFVSNMLNSALFIYSGAFSLKYLKMSADKDVLIDELKELAPSESHYSSRYECAVRLPVSYYVKSKDFEDLGKLVLEIAPKLNEEQIQAYMVKRAKSSPLISSILESRTNASSDIYDIVYDFEHDSSNYKTRYGDLLLTLHPEDTSYAKLMIKFDQRYTQENGFAFKFKFNNQNRYYGYEKYKYSN